MIPPGQGPPTLTTGPDWGGGGATCNAGNFTAPLAPLARWIDPVHASTLASTGACAVTGVWLEKDGIRERLELRSRRGRSSTAQSQLGGTPGSPTVQIVPTALGGRLITCANIGDAPLVTRPAVTHIAIEVAFTAASITNIVSGQFQQQFPGAYVHQTQTAYCQEHLPGQPFVWDQRPSGPDSGDFVDPGEYTVQVRVCTLYACHQTDAHDPLQMKALVVSPSTQ